jgi:D-arabinonate dehydratase
MTIVLYLDADWQPLRVEPWTRAITGIFLGKIEVVVYSRDRTIKGVACEYPMPAVVRVLRRFRRGQPAIRFSRLIEPLDITWFEEPCHWQDDVALMARVRHATRIPVNAGQCEITSQGVRRLVDGGAVDFVNFDVSEGGGITDWRRAAAMCFTASVRMAHHEEAQVAQHLLSAVPHGTYLECFADPDRDPIWQKMWLNRPAIRNGIAEIKDEPGLGIVLDQKMIAQYRVA